jgi:N-acetyl-alpha-D-glucosaminyl L-malate synthase BshA
MRIGIICYPTYGGSGVVATELGKALSERGHEIHFITYNQPFRLDDILENITYHEVQVSEYPLFDYTPYELVLTSKLVDVVKYEKLDLLHAHYAIPHASAAYMAQQILKSEGIHIPFITTLHGTDITLVGKDPSFEPVITFTINQSNAVTAVSESLKQDTLKYFNVKGKEIKVIPNFIDLKKFDSPVDERAKLTLAPHKEKVIMHISNFRPVKRIEDLVKVFYQIRLKIPSKLVLIGDGPDRNKIEQMCRTQYFICDDVKFMGKMKSTEKILSLADLFLLPSETESFGLAALEAMAARVPVITTNTGGTPEVVANGYSGFTSNVGDINDMADNAIGLLTDENKLNIVRENARKQAAKFDIQNILPLYEALYKSLV